MLKLETPNLHEIGLDRVIAYGHTWSPIHELVPENPLRHGHAISIDMAYSATLANNRKLISDAEHRRILNLFSRAGLSMDHHQFDSEILAKATAAILKTRDGLLRAAIPSPIGSCVFLNDVSREEMDDALRRHKELMKEFPRNGEGLDAYVDASDTGYTEVVKLKEEVMAEAATAKSGKANTAKEINGINGVNSQANRVNGSYEKHGIANHINGCSNRFSENTKANGINRVNGLNGKMGGEAQA